MKGWIFLFIFILARSSGTKITFPGQGGSTDEQEEINVRLGLLAPLLGQHPIGKPLQQADRTISQPYIVNNPDSGCRCYAGYKCPTVTDGSHNTDGTGLIDIRIVNNPADGNKCINGVLCCYGNNQNDDYTNTGSGSYTNTGSGNSNQCGINNPFHQVHGYSPRYGESQFGEYPWVAVLLSEGKNYAGAGALIDNRHILTAAHKVQSYTGGGLVVRLGEWDVRTTQEPNAHVDIPVESVLVHPYFNAGNLKNDVAVLRLKYPVNYKRHIRPVCLPQSVSFVGKRCWVAGWGKDAFGNAGKFQFVQKEVDVPVISNRACENKLQQTRLKNYFQLDRTSFICAGGEEGKDSCTGDGGAPLVCNSKGRYYVVGLVAWGIGCAQQSVPGVYVNVANYLNWINSNLQNHR